MIESSYSTHQPLMHMQKDLKLALGLGDTLEQSLPLTATTNEIFKHAKRLGYANHDVAAVYIRARFWSPTPRGPSHVNHEACHHTTISASGTPLTSTELNSVVTADANTASSYDIATSKLTDNNNIQNFTDFATTSCAADIATTYKIGAVTNSSHCENRPLFGVGDTVTIINPGEIASTSAGDACASNVSEIASPSNGGDDSIAYDGDIGSASSDDDRPLIYYNGRNVDTDDTVIVITTSDGAIDVNINDGDIAVAADDGNVVSDDRATTSSASITREATTE